MSFNFHVNKLEMLNLDFNLDNIIPLGHNYTFRITFILKKVELVKAQLLHLLMQLLRIKSGFKSDKHISFKHTHVVFTNPRIVLAHSLSTVPSEKVALFIDHGKNY